MRHQEPRCDIDAEPAVLVGDWHDFYALVGTAAATPVGLMFVADSIGADISSEKDLEPMKAFITSPVVHFSIARSSASWRAFRPKTWTMRGQMRQCRWFNLFGTDSNFQPLRFRD